MGGVGTGSSSYDVVTSNTRLPISLPKLPLLSPLLVTATPHAASPAATAARAAATPAAATRHASTPIGAATRRAALHPGGQRSLHRPPPVVSARCTAPHLWPGSRRPRQPYALRWRPGRRRHQPDRRRLLLNYRQPPPIAWPRRLSPPRSTPHSQLSRRPPRPSTPPRGAPHPSLVASAR